MSGPSEGIVLLRGQAGFEQAASRALANARRPDRQPEAIALPGSPGDVLAAVALARERGWRLDARSGGHSWSGSHLHDDGMLIDLSRMTGCTIDAEAGTAFAQPGLRSSLLSAQLAEHDLFFPTGHCIGPALGGFLLQGGFGWNSRLLGPACMSVTAIEAVTVAGESLHASAEQNADLFWAARGAGPGFPAIVTGFQLKLTPRPPIQVVSSYLFPIELLDELMRWAHEVGPSVPRSIEMMVFMRRQLGGREEPSVRLLAPVLAASDEQVDEDLRTIEECPLLEKALEWREREPTDVRELVAGSAEYYPEGHRYAVDNMWTSAPVDRLLPGYRRIAETIPDSPSHMMWMNWSPGGSERPDMAYSLEDEIYIGLYGAWASRSDDRRFAGWATGQMRELEHLATGIQLADENLEQRPQPFLAPANMARLERIRERYDPDGVLYGYNFERPATGG